MTVGECPLFPLLCSSCRTPLPAALCNSDEPILCRHCSKQLQVELFPAILKPLHEGGSVGLQVTEGEASCFYHPDKQAIKICSSCGRFICSLCEIDLAGRCLCPVCLEQGRQNEQLSELVTKRTLHDSIALNTALLPLLIWPVTLITAPIALYLALTAWRKPTSILPRTRIRIVFALLFSVLQIIAWAALGVFLFQKWSS
ncbi:MAG: hypothetical protein OEL57_00330 [Trichlorobacter sp.]|uniref:hypothetical protein n=1 Tax=Trichlorobacter sp. TaxID=2911007 RepID=UPI00255EF83B|nr:hypothetical protein [Trichlorobacter sp.]MDK9716336.1 hypothetical protein [Trichlorobacter sp.]